MLGLTYLPTAQRLSFSIVKATNLKYNSAVDKLEDFRKFLYLKETLDNQAYFIPENILAINWKKFLHSYLSGPYIRILQVSSKNGRVIRKKKTAVRAGTIEPEFNETLHFDLQPTQVETMIFLVMLSHRSIPEVNYDYLLHS